MYFSLSCGSIPNSYPLGNIYNSYLEHMLIYTGKRPCQYKPFLHTKYIIAIVMIRPGERPYCCSQCENVFACISNSVIKTFYANVNRENHLFIILVEKKSYYLTFVIMEILVFRPEPLKQIPF